MTENRISRWVFLPMYTMSIHKDIARRGMDKLEEYGLSKIHMPYLIVLSENDGMTLKELSEILDFDKANTTRAISSLRKEGYVTDDRKTESSRKYNVYLTEKGERIASEMKGVVNAAFDEYLEGIDDEEVRNFEMTFEKIFRVVSKYGPPGGFGETVSDSRPQSDN